MDERQMATRYTLTSRDVAAINSTATRLGIQPADLTAAMMYETIGTMNPDITGGKGGNYQGLIQFGPSERRMYGFQKGMGFAEQVEGPVYRYLKDRGVQPGMDIGRIYRTINGGNPNAKLTKNDGNGTIAQHIARIKADFLPRAQQVLAATPAGPDVSAIMDVAALNDGTSTVPYQPTAAQGFAPDLGGVRDAPAQTAIADMLAGGQSLTPEQIDQLTMTDAAGNYLNPPSLPPTPQPPPQWASAQGFPIDESLTGQTAQDVLAGGPRMDPRRAPPGSGPVPADMGAMRSPLDVLNAGPNLDPRRAIASGPVGPTTPQGVLDMGPNLRPPNVPTPPMRPERGAGIPDPRMRPDPASLPQRGFPTAYGEQPQPPVPYVPMVAGRPEFPGALPAASRTGDMSAAMGGPPAPPDPLAGFGTRDLAAETQAIRTIANANYYRPQNIMAPPPLAGGMSAAMGGPPAPPPPPDFTAASDPAPALTLNDPYANQRRPSSFETAQQNFQMPEGWTPGGDAPPPPAMFNPPYNQAAEWFKGNTPGYTDTAFNNAPLPPPPTPTPTAPQGTPSTWGKGLPLPSFMSQDQFNVSFAPGGPGVIADLNAPSTPAPSTAAQGNPFDALLGPGAAMAAIPFNDVSQGIGSPDFGNARAASVWDSMPPSDLGLGPQNIMAPPASPSPSLMSGASAFYRPDAPDPTFAGGSVVRPPTPVPGQPGVVQGTMPGAMDIRPPAQGGPPLPPQALPQASPAPAPRQTNVGAERQRNGTLGRILGGLLGGPVGALGGGLLGGGGGGIFGGGGGFGFGGQPTYAWSGGGTTPGGVGYRTGTSNAVGGSNATSWQNSKGNGTVTVVQDPWTGTYYGPSYGP